MTPVRRCVEFRCGEGSDQNYFYLLLPGLPGSPLYLLKPNYNTTLKGVVRTAIVRCGQLRPDGTLVKPLQQVPMNGPLVVPLATLDSELQPVK
jgi:hypothetical protein